MTPDTLTLIYTALASVTSLVVALVALVKAIRGDGRSVTPDTPADSKTTDQ